MAKVSSIPLDDVALLRLYGGQVLDRHLGLKVGAKTRTTLPEASLKGSFDMEAFSMVDENWSIGEDN